jgi:hypothetical protein
VIDPVFAALFRDDVFYTNTDTSKWSINKLDDTWMTYTEGINHKFPGYGIDKKFLIYNMDDNAVDLEDLKNLLISKDLNYYHKVKD